MDHTRANGMRARGGTGGDRLLDGHGRRLDYLRLSVTDACNLRCRYCLPEGTASPPAPGPVLDDGEILRLGRLLCALGVRKIRLTGGEPLVRRGVIELVRRLRDLSAAPELVLTTNGVLLAPHLPDLARHGVRRLNVSLDSLDRGTYAAITGRDAHDEVRRALDRADADGFVLKLNVVVLAGLNDGEIPDFVALTRARPWTVRFIEAMPFDGRGGRGGERLAGDEILARIRRRFALEPEVSPAAAVEELHRVPGHAGRIGIIRAWTRHFCGHCTRLRISARGELRTCLYGRPELDLGALLRSGADDGTLAEAIRAAVRVKPVDGHDAEFLYGCRRASMAGIGG
jgi:cyclic pyranopterin phosphate synthase